MGRDPPQETRTREEKEGGEKKGQAGHVRPRLSWLLWLLWPPCVVFVSGPFLPPGSSSTQPSRPALDPGTHPLFLSQSKRKRGCVHGAKKSEHNALCGSTSLGPHRAQFPLRILLPILQVGRLRLKEVHLTACQ